MTDTPDLDEIRAQLKRAAQHVARAERNVVRAIAARDTLMRAARDAGIGPSEMARLTDMTRDWAAKIAPDPDAKPRHRPKS